MQHDKGESSWSKCTLLKKVRELGVLGLRVLVKIGRVVIILVLVLLSYPVLEFIIEYGRARSEAYHVATQFAVTNSDVLRVTGPVSSVRIDNRFNFHFCGKQADYTLDLTGELADVILQIQVKDLADSWVVTEAALRTAGHPPRVIRQTTTDWYADADEARVYPFLWRNACYATSFPPMLTGTSGGITDHTRFSRHTPQCIHAGSPIN